MPTKKELKDLLKENTLNVLFKKKDGTERNMLCTLNPKLLPAVDPVKSSQKKEENENVLPVWDLEQKAFRSFRLDSVLKYELQIN